MEILKSIVLDRSRMAKFKYAIDGVLYYEVESDIGKKYLFTVDMNDKDDVGTSTFDAEIKAATLMRYIRRSISDGSIIEIKENDY